MSDSLPYIGVTAVAVSRYAVTTQDSECRSPKSRPMVGSAVATMVWSSAPRNIASMMPMTMARISGCVRRTGSSLLAAGFAAALGAAAFAFGLAVVDMKIASANNG